MDYPLWTNPNFATSLTVLEYRKTHRPILPAQKMEKIPNFGPKPWVNPFGKISIFGLFELLVFIA